MRFIHKLLGAIAAAALLGTLLPASPGRADIAPPEQAPGSNITPETATRVQMVAERVVIEVLRVKGTGGNGLPVANVTATFTMRNNSPAGETLRVRFPLTDPGGMGDGFGGHPEIEQFTVRVNGRRAATQIITTPNPRGADEPNVKWATFEVTFPPGQDVEITVEYILQSTGYMPYGRFKYILETGAGWDGPIGTAEFIVKLPYPANEQNVAGASLPGGTFGGNQVRWTVNDIEPGPADNFFVTVLAPAVWQRILEAKQAAERQPTRASAWRNLAQAYLSAIFVKYGPEAGAQFIPLVEEAYRRAQESDPTSAQLHAELAQVFLDLFPPILALDPAAIEKVIAALEAAFTRDPQNALAQKILAELSATLERFAQAGGAEAQTAQRLLDRLNRMARETGAQKFAPTPAATLVPTAAITPTLEVTPPATPATALTPVPEATPTTPPTPAALATPAAIVPTAEPIITTDTITTVTAAGAVVTTTIVSTATATLTDTVSARPVEVTTVQSAQIITQSADVTGTVPVTVTEVRETTVITAPQGGEAIPGAGSVVTATTTTTTTSALDERGAVRPETSVVITATTIATATVEASPLDATRPATTTVVVVTTRVSPQTTGEAAPGTSTTITSTTVTTATTGSAQAGVTPPTSIITQTEVVTATVERPAEGAPPVITIITATTITTATVDASGVTTPGIPVVGIVTATLPAESPAALPATPIPLATPTPVPGAAAAPEATATEVTATEVAATEVAATEVAATPMTPGPTPGGQGLPLEAWLALLLTYAAGGAAVYGIHSAAIRRDRTAGK